MRRDLVSRRRFLRRLGSAAVAVSAASGTLRAAPTRRCSRVLFLSRPGAYEPEVVRRDDGGLSLAERRMVELGRRLDVDVECKQDGSVLDGDLDRFDAFVLFWNHDPMKTNRAGQPPVSARGKGRLIDAVAAGRGCLGIHCAAYSFLSGKQNELQPPDGRDPYVQMLGGELHACLPKQDTRHRIVSPGFPGADQIGATTVTLHDEPYGLKNYADDLHVVAVQETEGLDNEAFQRPPFPCVWARHHGHGRVFYVSWGHDDDAWRSEPFEQIVSGGLRWTLGRVEADVTPNLKTVCPMPEPKT